MIRDIAIYGAGGLGREMALMLQQINEEQQKWKLLGFFDDGKSEGEQIDHLPVLGGIGALNSWDQTLAVIVALADPLLKEELVGKISNCRVYYPALVHPRALMGSSENTIGRGSIITAGCILTTHIAVGDFVIINLACTIGHDVRIGNFSSIMPGCNISGSVDIGEANLIGTGARILQNLSTGSRCSIGAGAVVTRDVPDGVVAKGVPARW